MRDVTTLARAIATKVAGDLIDAAPLAVIEKVASESLNRLYGETGVIIRVCETLAEPLRQRLDTPDARGGFTGQLSVLGDPALAGADCRIEWSNGMAERDSDAVWRDIRETISRFVSDDDAPTGVHRAPADPPEPRPRPRPTGPTIKRRWRRTRRQKRWLKAWVRNCAMR